MYDGLTVDSQPFGRILAAFRAASSPTNARNVEGHGGGVPDFSVSFSVPTCDDLRDHHEEYMFFTIELVRVYTD